MAEAERYQYQQGLLEGAFMAWASVLLLKELDEIKGTTTRLDGTCCCVYTGLVGLALTKHPPHDRQNQQRYYELLASLGSLTGGSYLSSQPLQPTITGSFISRHVRIEETQAAILQRPGFRCSVLFLALTGQESTNEVEYRTGTTIELGGLRTLTRQLTNKPG